MPEYCCVSRSKQSQSSCNRQLATKLGLTLRRALLPFLALSLGSEPCLAGAWLQEPGSGQVIFGSRATVAFRWFDDKGKPRSSGQFLKQETAVTIEYGMIDGLSVLAGTQMQRQTIPTVDWQVQAAGISGLLGAKLRLWSNTNWVLSVQAAVQGAGERLMLDYTRRLEAPAQVDLRANFGHSLQIADLPAFVEMQVGYRWRGGSNADEIRADATVGLRPIPDLLLMVQSFNTLAVNRNRRFATGSVRQHRIQPSVVYDMTENWSVQIGAFISLKGRNTLNEQGVVLALWRRL